MTHEHAHRLLKRADRLRRQGLAVTSDFAFPPPPAAGTPAYARGVRAYMLGEAAFWRAGGDREEARACLAAALAWRKREKGVRQ